MHFGSVGERLPAVAGPAPQYSWAIAPPKGDASRVRAHHLLLVV